MYTPSQISFQFMETMLGSISLAASVYCYKNIRKYNDHYRLIDCLHTVLIGADTILSVMFIIGRAGVLNEKFCIFQGFMIQFAALLEVFWLACNGYQLFKWVYKKKSARVIKKKLKRYFVACTILSLVVAFILLGNNSYGPAETWCWISNNDLYVMFPGFYLFLLIAWIYDFLVLGAITQIISVRVDQNSLISGKKSELTVTERAVRRKLRIFVSVFVFTWAFPLLNDIIVFCTGKPIFITNLLQSIILPSQGILNAIAYGGILDEDSELNEWLLKNYASIHRLAFGILHIDTVVRRASLNPQSSETEINVQVEPVKYSIFATTLNIGEGKVDDMKDELKHWIVSGHDIYVIGVQECLELEQLREEIHALLGGDNQFVMYSSEIGSSNTSLGFHGFIGLTVFLRADLVGKGYLKVTEASLQTVATGANLYVTTAANKGGVGIPIQIHDVSFGFATCHLPSDSKGVSKLRKRNEACRSLLHDLTLVSDDYGFDCHLQHDHFMVMGDLNYRMEAMVNNVSALTGVSIAASLEKEALGDDPEWMQRRYALLHGKNTPGYPSQEEIMLINKAKIASRGAWGLVLQQDELRRLMADGEVFSEFEEPLPTFPPSYKRKKGAAGDCGDYTDPVLVLQGFSNTGEVSEEPDDSNDRESVARESTVRESTKDAIVQSSSGDIEDQQPSRKSLRVQYNIGNANTPKEMRDVRPPSYTDRILLYSLSDRRGKARIVAYDMCDLLRVSDHRAVSMVVEVEVNKRIHSNAPPEGLKMSKIPLVSGTAAVNSAFPLTGTSSLFVELIIRNLNIQIDEDINDKARVASKAKNTDVENPMISIEGGKTPAKRGMGTKTGSIFNILSDASNESDKLSPNSVQSVTVLFPLPSKDPMVIYRSMYDLTQELKITPKIILKSLQGGAWKQGGLGKFNKELLLKPLHSFNYDDAAFLEIRVPGCVCPELGAHCLVRANNAAGDSLGECVVSLESLLKNMHYEKKLNVNIPLTHGASVRGTLTASLSLSNIHSGVQKDTVARSALLSSIKLLKKGHDNA